MIQGRLQSISFQATYFTGDSIVDGFEGCLSRGSNGPAVSDLLHRDVDRVLKV
jgi:hypothetical protein